MKIIGKILGLIGIGGIIAILWRVMNTANIPRKVPKGTPPGTYEINMEDWEFPED